ncbi:MAG TPA: hypothetical protein VL400_22745 [Polyangiaceae bacterium]|nr:hypothetical protein [Polyangiaceae bacterium]
MKARRDGLGRSLVVAAAIHAALVGLLATRQSPEIPAPPPEPEATETVDGIEIELVARTDRPTPPQPRVEPRPDARGFARTTTSHRVGARASARGAAAARRESSSSSEDGAWTPEIDGASRAGSADGGAESPPPALSLSERLAFGDGARPAPTHTEPPRVVTAEQSEEAIRSVVRYEDAKLGLGNPQEGIVARAVQEVGRASGVPSGTHFAVTVVIDGDGEVKDASIRGDDVGAAVWPETLAGVLAILRERPIELGPDERSRGAVVRVEATLLHVYASGSDKPVYVGECLTMPRVGGEEPAPFVNIGGALHGQPGNGRCAFADATDAAIPKTIAVRTQTTSIWPGDAPLPAYVHPMPPPERRAYSIPGLVYALIEHAVR